MPLAVYLQVKIDLQVYRLYNLIYEEVLLVELTFAMPHGEYEMQHVLSR